MDMNDLFEKEALVLQRSRAFLDQMGADVPEQTRKEFAYLAEEYGQVLRQLRWVTRISDLTATGLHSDKALLLNKVNVDALTEIYNRRYLMSNLEHCLDELEANGAWITVMMLDVDYFKLYNDTYGHPAGDACLRKVAHAIHISLSGADDFVVRYGGEEFIVVLPGADMRLGLYVAEKIQENIRELAIRHMKNEVSDFVTMSVGVVSSIPNPRVKMQEYIDRADAALYLSKKNGRNRVTYLSLEEETT